MERTYKLSNSPGALRQFGTSTATSERERQTKNLCSRRDLWQPGTQKTRIWTQFRLESRKERSVLSNFASLLDFIYTQSSLFTCVWYEGLLVRKHFCHLSFSRLYANLITQNLCRQKEHASIWNWYPGLCLCSYSIP